MKFLFGYYQDIRIKDIWYEQFKKSKNTTSEFTEENLKILYKKRNYSIDIIFFDIPLPDNLANALLNPYIYEYELKKKVLKKINEKNEHCSYSKIKKHPEFKDFQKQMEETHLIVDSLNGLLVHVFTYDIGLRFKYDLFRMRETGEQHFFRVEAEFIYG